MASQGPNKPSPPQGGPSQSTMAQPRFARHDAYRPVSVVSSRMTDIPSDDEAAEAKKPPAKATHRPKLSDARPETARTGASSSKGPWAGGPRKGFPMGTRGNLTSQTANSLSPGRSPSLTSRSHVPSLTSNAFFHPMSSQKLQAQRAAVARPPTTQSPPPAALQGDISDNATDVDGSVVQDLASLQNHILGVRHIVYSNGEDDTRVAPPSRGTEGTDRDTCDRTAGTPSPSSVQDHHASSTMSEGLRALQKGAADGVSPSLMFDDKDSRGVETAAGSPGKHKPQNAFSPYGFSDVDLHPGVRHHTANTGTVEKHSSVTSSSRLNPVDSRTRRKSRASTAPTQQPPSKGKNYEYFEGNTVFFFGGRWQNTRQRPINIATGLFIVVPCVLFFVFEAPWLWHNISPAIPVVFAYLAYICFSSFVHASISDPGILPRNLHHFPPLTINEDPLHVDHPTNDWTLIRSAEPTAAAMEVPVKHCRTCNIWRPPRAHHCRLCDNCIETHDHHCVWLNNCVGKRNYRYFFTFVSAATLLSLYLVGASLAQLLVYRAREGITFGRSINHFRVAFSLVIVGVILFCYPAALMAYHVFLMSRGETTREFMNSHKFAKQERYRAFSTGHVLSNLLAVLCRPRSPTYYQFKTKYKFGDQRLGLHRGQRPRLNSWGVEMSGIAGESRGGFQGPVALQEAARG